MAEGQIAFAMAGRVRSGRPGLRSALRFPGIRGADPSRLELQVRDAGAELVDRVGPIVLTRSRGAPLGWQIADARPDLVMGILAVEPNGPPVYDVVRGLDGFGVGVMSRPWGLTLAPLTYSPPVGSAHELTFVYQTEATSPDLAPYWLQAEPAKRLPNLARTGWQ